MRRLLAPVAAALAIAALAGCAARQDAQPPVAASVGESEPPSAAPAPGSLIDPAERRASLDDLGPLSPLCPDTGPGLPPPGEPGILLSTASDATTLLVATTLGSRAYGGLPLGWTDDGLVAVSAVPDDREVVLLLDPTGERHPVEHPVATGSHPVGISPDGAWLAELRGRWATGLTGELWLRRLDASAERLVASVAASGTRAAWSPDGRRLAYASARGIHVLELDGAGDRRVTGGHDADPAWSPDGRRLAFVRNPEGSGTGGDAWVVAASGGDERNVSNTPVAESSPSWLADGSGIVATSPLGGCKGTRLWAFPLDGGPPQRIAPEIESAAGPRTGPRGALAFTGVLPPEATAPTLGVAPS